jgi:hypothetical protein
MSSAPLTTILQPGTTLPGVAEGDTRQKKADRKAERHAFFCAVCGKPSKKRCTRCLVAKYCSKECQVYHWKHGKHRSICAIAPTADMAGAQDEAHFQCISTFTKNASKAGQLGFVVDEIRMLRYLIRTLPNQMDTLFCLAAALLKHGEFRQSIEMYTQGMAEVSDICLQIECMKRRFTSETKQEKYPHVEFPQRWRAALPPEDILCKYLSQNMHAVSNAVEQCIRGRNDLEMEIVLLNLCTKYIERRPYDEHERIAVPSDGCCCRVYYVKGETHRKFMQRPDVAEDCFMTADGYMQKSKGVHDFVSLTAVPDLCVHQVQLLMAEWVERGNDAVVVSEHELAHAFALIDRALRVSRMMMEQVDCVQNSQEYTSVLTTLSKTLWNSISVKDKLYNEMSGDGEEEKRQKKAWIDAKKKVGNEALSVAKKAKVECIKGHCIDVPEIDQQNLAAVEILIQALENEGFSNAAPRVE